MKKTLALLALIGFSSFAAASALPSVSLTNGSFEDTAITNNWNVFSELNGWTVSSVGVEVRDSVAGSAYEGTNFVELDTHGVALNGNTKDTNSWISQSFNVVAGYTYSLSFAYSARNIPGLSNQDEYDSNKIKVVFSQSGNSFRTETVSGNNDQSFNDWKLYSYSFNPLSSGSVTVKFLADGRDDTYGGSLDAVSLTVSAVPEPETYAMFLAGLGLMVGVARRRKQAA